MQTLGAGRKLTSKETLLTLKPVYCLFVFIPIVLQSFITVFVQAHIQPYKCMKMDADTEVSAVTHEVERHPILNPQGLICCQPTVCSYNSFDFPQGSECFVEFITIVPEVHL